MKDENKGAIFYHYLIEGLWFLTILEVWLPKEFMLIYHLHLILILNKAVQFCHSGLSHCKHLSFSFSFLSFIIIMLYSHYLMFYDNSCCSLLLHQHTGCWFHAPYPLTVGCWLAFAVQVCVRVLEAAVWGAQYNVLTNIVAIRNKEFTDQVSFLLSLLFVWRHDCSLSALWPRYAVWPFCCISVRRTHHHHCLSTPALKWSKDCSCLSVWILFILWPLSQCGQFGSVW